MTIEFRRKGDPCEAVEGIAPCGDNVKKIPNKLADLAKDIFDQKVKMPYGLFLFL